LTSILLLLRLSKTLNKGLSRNVKIYNKEQKNKQKKPIPIFTKLAI